MELKKYDWKLLGGLAFFKLLIHLLANTNYGFHRDEYLYLAQGEHLGLGYMEVPPMIAIYAKMALSLGGSLFLVRLLPTLIGVLSVILIGMLIKDLGGKRWAQFFGCVAFIVAPVFLRANMLFQPVAFNQFMWLFSSFLMIRLVNTQNAKYWFYFGIVAGFAILTKYSVAFFYVAMLIGMFLSKQRKWLTKPQPYLAVLIALIIASPNIWWQFQHNFPVIHHMQELKETQLANVQIGRFFGDQLFMMLAANLVWIAGLAFLFRNQSFKKYRFLAWTFIFTIIIIAYLNGKAYYTVGAYSMLFVFGGLAIEYWLKSSKLKWALAAFMIIITIPFTPYSITILPINQMKSYCTFMKNNIGLDSPLYWEDGKIHDIPQDYADMFGWEEIVKNVSDYYHTLPDSLRNSCSIYGGSYGHAGAINYYREKYDLPEAISFNSSFMIWAPEKVNFRCQIQVDDTEQNGSSYFESMELIGQNKHPFCREPGLIYFKSKPIVDIPTEWNTLTKEMKAEFDF